MYFGIASGIITFVINNCIYVHGFDQTQQQYNTLSGYILMCSGRLLFYQVIY